MSDTRDAMPWSKAIVAGMPLVGAGVLTLSLSRITIADWNEQTAGVVMFARIMLSFGWVWAGALAIGTLRTRNEDWPSAANFRRIADGYRLRCEAEADSHEREWLR